MEPSPLVDILSDCVDGTNHCWRVYKAGCEAENYPSGSHSVDYLGAPCKTEGCLPGYDIYRAPFCWLKGGGSTWSYCFLDCEQEPYDPSKMCFLLLCE